MPITPNCNYKLSNVVLEYFRQNVATTNGLHIYGNVQSTAAPSSEIFCIEF